MPAIPLDLATLAVGVGLVGLMAVLLLSVAVLRRVVGFLLTIFWFPHDS